LRHGPKIAHNSGIDFTGLFYRAFWTLKMFSIQIAVGGANGKSGGQSNIGQFETSENFPDEIFNDFNVRNSFSQKKVHHHAARIFALNFILKF